ncbi:LytR/AlgR family response regulator transcription factor [Paenibacillus wynnii]|uniref:Histidine kinase n=1 Tax=Paenibacillus wynnii TaxID=268407 RepID=A0A098M376_9BACL|nr:LytTR family DNA-binding domain-containing protein [Paenibacillus wynnii]KGE16443.1 hypothetical protein PWYN_17055 [Paenibacillus wynnii]
MSKYTCIIAEDQSTYRSQLMLYAQQQELVLMDAVGTGKALIESAMEHGPDLIITDISLPKMDGLTACKQLIKQGLDTQIIIISASSEPVHYSQGFEIGSVDYINKPITPDRFERAIQRAKYKIDEQRLIKRLRHVEENIIRVKQRYRDISINEGNILFAEKIDKRVFQLHLVENTVIETTTNLEQIKYQCSEQIFQPHRSYLINISHIQTVQPDPILPGNYEIIYMKQDKTIPLTRRNYPAFMQLCKLKKRP